MPPEILRSLECNGRLPPPPAPLPSPHPTLAAPHPPRRGKRRVPRFGTWRWCRRPPKPSTRTPCGKIPPKSAAVCPCLTRSRAPSPGGCWRLQQRIRLTAAAVLAGVGGRVRRLPLASRRLSSVAGRPPAAPKAPEPRASPRALGGVRAPGPPLAVIACPPLPPTRWGENLGAMACPWSRVPTRPHAFVYYHRRYDPV